MLSIDSNFLLGIQEFMRIFWLNPIMVFITHLGDGGIVWIVISSGLIYFKRTRKLGIVCLYALGISFVINNMLLKPLVARPRPFTVLKGLAPLIPLPKDLSFPSGHAAASFACATLLYRKLPKKYGLPAMILAGLIAFSRMYVGVHYPSDVVVGITSGIGCSYMADFIMSHLFFKHSKTLVDEVNNE